MWTTLAFVAAMSAAPAQAPAQSAQVQLANPRVTYGILGPKRPNNQILPGETFFFSFDILNLPIIKEGEIQYSMGMELINPMGQSEYKREPQKDPIKVLHVLGGNSVPAFAHAGTEATYPPGKYTLKVTVIDGVSKKAQTISQDFQVLGKDFGIGDLVLTYDPQGVLSAPAWAVTGQTLLLNFSVFGFKADAMMKPNLSLSMRALDESGKPTTPQPIAGGYTEAVQANTTKLPFSFLLALNRAGNFTIELTATDKSANNKTTTVKFPLRVEAPK